MIGQGREGRFFSPSGKDMTSDELVRAWEERVALFRSLATFSAREELRAACELIVGALERGQKLLLMGNGGSAVQAQHMASELVGRFLKERRPLPALALTADTAVLSSLANDFGFGEVFERQVEALAQRGDVAIGISTSGGSENVLRGVKRARELGCSTLGILGGGGGSVKGAVDLSIVVPSDSVPLIQEAHAAICHIICQEVEQRLFPG
ncbi:MAG: SIS domain-containing protein [Nitrospinota bacterium]